MGGTGRHHYACQSQFLDVFLDEFLAKAGAHELVIARNHYALTSEMLSSPFADIRHINNSGNVGAAVTNINANSFSDRFLSIF